MGWEKATSMKDGLRAFLVVTDGKVNLAATESKFHDFLIRHNAGQEAEVELIAQCMGAVFDRYPSATLNANFIESQTVQAMCKQVTALNEPSLFSTLSKRVGDYLRENTNQPAKEATADSPAMAAVTGKLYNLRHGKGGGWSRA